MAEIVRHFQPKLVELHNYSSANSSTQKMYNWNTLNQKVFKKLGFIVTKQEIESVCNCEMGAIERVLKLVKVKIEAYNSRKQSSPGLEGSTTTADMVSTSPAAQGGVVDGPAGKQGEGAVLPGGYGGQGGRSDRSPLRPAHDQGEAAAAAPPAAIIEEYEKQLKEGKEIIEVSGWGGVMRRATKVHAQCFCVIKSGCRSVAHAFAFGQLRLFAACRPWSARSSAWRSWSGSRIRRSRRCEVSPSSLNAPLPSRPHGARPSYVEHWIPACLLQQQ